MNIRLLNRTENTATYRVYDINTKRFYRLEVFIRSEYQRIEDYLNDIKDQIHMLLHITEIESVG